MRSSTFLSNIDFEREGRQFKLNKTESKAQMFLNTRSKAIHLRSRNREILLWHRDEPC